MTGGIVVDGVGAAHYKSFVLDESSWPPRHAKLELEFGDGTRLAFCDSRRFARVRVRVLLCLMGEWGRGWAGGWVGGGGGQA